VTVNEKRLLALLAWSALLSICGLRAFLAFGRIQVADRSIAAYSVASDKLRDAEVDVAVLRERTAKLRSALGTDADADTDAVPVGSASGGSASGGSASEFAARVRSILAAEGIDPLRYRIDSSNGDESVEFTLRCDPVAFLRFLRAVSGNAGIEVPLLEMRPSEGTDGTAVTVRLRRAR